jgi:hypothetical protein
LTPRPSTTLARRLTIDWDGFQRVGDPDQQPIMWTAEPGSSSHDKLRSLSSWIQTAATPDACNDKPVFWPPPQVRIQAETRTIGLVSSWHKTSGLRDDRRRKRTVE